MSKKFITITSIGRKGSKRGPRSSKKKKESSRSTSSSESSSRSSSESASEEMMSHPVGPAVRVKTREMKTRTVKLEH